MPQLTDLRARRMSPGDKPVADGTIIGLRLEPGTVRGRGKWILRFVSPVSGNRRDLGLGVFPEVGIAGARAAGMAARQMIAAGKDPIDEREAARAANKAEAGALTFEQAARRVHEEQKPGWKNPKHADQWVNSLRDHVFPAIGSRKVADLTVNDFADALRPIWLTMPETASRVRQRCHTVMRWCQAHRFVAGNPVDVVAHLLAHQPGPRERVTHQPAMPWCDLPAFVETLRTGPHNVTRTLLEFLILTSARSGEARGATWDEVDLDAKVWAIPASRMKAKVAHRVPLSDRAMEILESQRKRSPQSDLIFPSPRAVVLSDMVLTKFLRDQKAKSNEPGRTATAHGFRASFRDWASENGYPRDLAERALAHTVRDATEAAYHRTDLLDQRRPMMDAWSKYVGNENTATVIPLARRRSRA